MSDAVEVQEVKPVEVVETTGGADDNAERSEPEVEKPVEAKPETEEDKEAKARHNRQGYERRLQKERAELKAERDALKKQLESIKPARDQYSDDDAYIEAVADYKVSQKLTERRLSEVEQVEQKTLYDNIQESVSSARQKYGDVFDSAFQHVKDVSIPNPVLNALVRNKNIAADLIHEVVVNRPDIIDLPDVEAIGEIAAIRNDLLRNRKTVEVKKITSAPPPVRPPAIGNGAIKKDLADLEGDDYKRARGYIK